MPHQRASARAWREVAIARPDRLDQEAALALEVLGRPGDVGHVEAGAA